MIPMFRLRPELSLVDESSIFQIDEKPFCIYDQRQCIFHYCDTDDFQVCVYLREWRNEQELVSFVRSIDSNQPYSYYIEGFRTIKILEEKSQEDKPATHSDDKAILFVAEQIPYVDRAQRPRGFPPSISLNITTACNLECLHCSQEAGGNHSISQLSLEEIVGLFDQFEKYALWDLRLSGGEPTCHPKLPEILHDAAKRRFGLVLFTNGTVLTPSLREAILQIAKDKPSFRIHLSIDGAQAKTHDWLRNRPGVFDKLMSFMKFLKDNNINWIAECVVTRRNMEELYKIAELVNDYGARLITFHVSSAVGRTIGGDPDLLLQLDEMQRIQVIGDDLAMRYDGSLGVNMANVSLPDGLVLPDNVLRKRQLSLIFQGERLLNQNREIHKIAALTQQEPYFYQRKRKYCSAGISQMTIEGDGSVYPCPFVATRADWSIGNVRESDVLSLWKSDKFLFFRGEWKVSDLPICSQCAWEKQCHLPKICRVASLVNFDDPYGPAPECVNKYKQLGSGLPDDLWEPVAQSSH